MYLVLFVEYLANVASRHINGYTVGRNSHVILSIPHSFTDCHKQYYNFALLALYGYSSSTSKEDCELLTSVHLPPQILQSPH